MTSRSVAPAYLFLFDIDGTLIASGGAGHSAMSQATEELFAAPLAALRQGRNAPLDPLEGVEIAGCTDHLITRSVFQKYGLPWTAERATAYLDRYLHYLALELPRRRGQLLPGILPLLQALHVRSDVALALLTGNLERGARLKLAHYGVWDFFEFGAYADDDYRREHLGPYARTRARERHGADFPPERIFVLGDTPHDITCGRAIGAKTVAIATGFHTQEELAAHRPDFLFADLSDVRAVLGTLGV